MSLSIESHQALIGVIHEDLIKTRQERDELLAALNGMLLVYSEMISNPPYHHTQELWVKVEAAIKLQDAITKAQGGAE